MALSLTEGQPTFALSQHLLLSLAEQLKLPLLQIAREAELQMLYAETCNTVGIQTTAETALKLIDGYILSVQLALDAQAGLELEPVSVSSVLYDAGHQLSALAKAYDVDIELSIEGKYGPVSAHAKGLQMALLSLGYSLIEALPAHENSQLKLRLSAHRCRYGIVAGLYCDSQQLTTETLRQGKQLYGRARQPFANISHTSGAGVFVADALLHAMQSQLKVSRYQKLYGLAAILQPNPQMQLV